VAGDDPEIMVGMVYSFRHKKTRQGGPGFNYHSAIVTLGALGMERISRIANRIFQNSWGRLAVLYSALCAFLAIVSAWGDRNPISSFGLWLISNLIYLPALFAPFGIAAWIGSETYKKTGYIWIGWLVGIVSAVTFSYLTAAILSHMPGIGWRFSSLLSTRDNGY
jgi:hypothetical protein